MLSRTPDTSAGDGGSGRLYSRRRDGLYVPQHSGTSSNNRRAVPGSNGAASLSRGCARHGWQAWYRRWRRLHSREAHAGAGLWAPWRHTPATRRGCGARACMESRQQRSHAEMVGWNTQRAEKLRLGEGADVLMPSRHCVSDSRIPCVCLFEVVLHNSNVPLCCCPPCPRLSAEVSAARVAGHWRGDIRGRRQPQQGLGQLAAV